jgi:hypothetical protein
MQLSVDRLDAGERAGNVPAGDQAGAINPGDVHDFRRVFRHLDVTGFLVADAEDVFRHEARRHLIELSLSTGIPFRDLLTVYSARDLATVHDVLIERQRAAKGPRPVGVAEFSSK